MPVEALHRQILSFQRCLHVLPLRILISASWLFQVFYHRVVGNNGVVTPLCMTFIYTSLVNRCPHADNAVLMALFYNPGNCMLYSAGVELTCASAYAGHTDCSVGIEESQLRLRWYFACAYRVVVKGRIFICLRIHLLANLSPLCLVKNNSCSESHKLILYITIKQVKYLTADSTLRSLLPEGEIQGLQFSERFCPDPAYRRLRSHLSSRHWQMTSSPSRSSSAISNSMPAQSSTAWNAARVF